MEEESTKSSIGRRLIAVLVIGVAAWILFKLVIGVVAAVAGTVAIVVAIIALIWAIRTLTHD